MNLIIRLAGFALALMMLSTACSTAPKYHPTLMCQAVGPGLLACMDADELMEKMKLQGPPGMPLTPKPQRAIPAPSPTRPDLM